MLTRQINSSKIQTCNFEKRKMIARNLLLFKPACRVARRFGKKMSELVDVEKIEVDPDFTPTIPLST